MWIMISGPYRSGSHDPQVWAANLAKMNEAALQVLKRGHVPLIGVNMALPIIAAAGEEHYLEIMMPVSMALSERCDAVLRIGGLSANADREVEVFRKKGLKEFKSIEEVPYSVETGGPG